MLFPLNADLLIRKATVNFYGYFFIDIRLIKPVIRFKLEGFREAFYALKNGFIKPLRNVKPARNWQPLIAYQSLRFIDALAHIVQGFFVFDYVGEIVNLFHKGILTHA